MFGRGWLFRLSPRLRLRRARRVRRRRARADRDRGAAAGGLGAAAAAARDGGVVARGPGATAVAANGGAVGGIVRGSDMFGRGWLFRLAPRLRLRRARRVRRRRARANRDGGAAVGGLGPAVVGEGGVAAGGPAVAAGHGGVVVGGPGVAAVAADGGAVGGIGDEGLEAGVLPPLEFICRKVVPKSEIEKNLEVPVELYLLFGGRRQILLCDDHNTFLMGVGWRSNGRAFFLMSGWRHFYWARNVHEGSILQFWTTVNAHTFYVEVLDP